MSNEQQSKAAGNLVKPSGEQGAGFDASQSTQAAPTRTRRDLGADGDATLPEGDRGGNLSCRAGLTDEREDFLEWFRMFPRMTERDEVVAWEAWQARADRSATGQPSEAAVRNAALKKAADLCDEMALYTGVDCAAALRALISQPQAPVEPQVSIDALALNASRQIMAEVRGPALLGGDVQLQARIQEIVATFLEVPCCQPQAQVTDELPPLPFADLGFPWRLNAKDGSVHSGGYTPEQMRDYARLCLSCARRAAPVNVPEGYKLVPVEPTQEMMHAWDAAPFDIDSDTEFKNAYRYMLAAAPSASVEPGKDQWISVEDRLPDEETMCLVFVPESNNDHAHIRIEYFSDGCWNDHNDHYEHFMAVGGAGAAGPDVICTGPSADAPYTHWMPLPAAPSAISTQSKGGE